MSGSTTKARSMNINLPLKLAAFLFAVLLIGGPAQGSLLLGERFHADSAVDQLSVDPYQGWIIGWNVGWSTENGFPLEPAIFSGIGVPADTYTWITLTDGDVESHDAIGSWQRENWSALEIDGGPLSAVAETPFLPRDIAALDGLWFDSPGNMLSYDVAINSLSLGEFGPSYAVPGTSPWAEEWNAESEPDVDIFDFDSLLTPEPASLAIWTLLGVGWTTFCVHRRRRRGILADDLAVAPAPVDTPQTRWSEENRHAILQIIERGRHQA